MFKLKNVALEGKFCSPQ